MTSIAACLIPEDKGQLKAELQNLRRKGALKPSADWDIPGQDPDRSCGRCRVELGRVINRGAYCRACRLKVCKGCREYSLRTTDWVCTVCHKQMEIQAASGEWMNEFVRRPSRRRDTRVYVPAADIIKRTIRRSWTISNPTPIRWNILRGSPELRPYNSLPRGQDINNYPSLAIHQANLRNKQNSQKISADSSPSPPYRRRSPARRTHSEDIYSERENSSIVRDSSPVSRGGSPIVRGSSPIFLKDAQPIVSSQKGMRVNPLMRLVENKQAREGKRSPKRMQNNEGSSEEGSSKEEEIQKSKGIPTPEPTKKSDFILEKRVSFESNINLTNTMMKDRLMVALRNQAVKEARLLEDGKMLERRSSLYHSHQGDQSDNSEESGSTSNELHYAREETAPIETCDIEPISGTVFRKVTVRRRHQESVRKISPVESGWRRGPESDLLDILLPESDDYKLVFINSDSSSKEETSSKEEDDNDSSSTASSFPIDECDWDYFEPGSGRPPPVLNWSSPFGSPRVYRRGVIESPIGSPLVYRRRIRESDTGTDEDIAHLESGSPASSDSIYQSRIIGGTEESFDQHRNEKVMEDAAALQCLHADDAASQRPPCHNCGAPTQYIPIPVPVPIPFPVPTLWTPQDTLLLYGAGEQNPGRRLRVLPRNLWPYLTQAALIWPSVNAGEFGPLHSVLHNNIGDCGANTGATMPVATDHDSQLACAGTSDTEPGGNNKDNDAPEDENDHPAVIGEREELTGYLECENRYVSSSDTSRDSSDSSDTSENENSKPRVRRVYNVNGGEGRQSDDALPSSNVTSDGDDEDGRLSHSSVREDMSSSGSEDTDSDDTGTVADQKPKRFSRIFVVNKNLSSSSNESSRSSDTESSDNDTDTEMDCTVILTHMKPLDENDCANHVFDVNKDTVALNADKDDTNQIQGCDNETSDKNNEKLSEEVRVESRHIETPANVKESEYISSSPGLSDVSAESLNSSDVDEARMDAIAEEESPFLSEAAKQDDHCATISEWNEIRSSGPVSVEGESQNTRDHEGVSAGAIVSTESLAHHAARYTSLVMITQESAPNYQQVSVVTSDTTTLVPDNDVIVRHTNWQADAKRNSGGKLNDNQNQGESVTVITGGETLSAFEEGLADDDSWVENLSHEDDEDEFATNSPTDDSSSGEEVTLTCSAAIDHEEDLRGYHRTAIDFTLHTIVEESCEESEVEQNAAKKKERPASATDLEKYFFFGLGDGTIPSLSSNREDAFSETSSIYSEGMESLGGEDTLQQSDNSDPAELASSRLEKYFLSGFMGFTAERRDSDGSVGSDSEGRPSPEQRRKRLVRARGTGRSHSSSLDNLDNAGNEQIAETQINSENSSSSDSDSNEEINSFEKSDGQFDTVKRKKCKKHKNSTSPAEETRNLETTQEVDEKGTESDEDGHKTPQPEIATPSNLTTTKNQQSRDSGFIGSCDDLLREQRDNSTPELIPPGKSDLKIDLEDITEEKKVEVEDKIVPTSTPPATSLTRKDSFNNWSSDEETNLMMSKMRQFFKTMVANSQLSSSSKPSTPNLSSRMSPKPLPSPRAKNRSKPPQLIYFENELTRLMKTVPGIREDQVREIVEYLSSEDTWSDSYDSSDYTSSDLEVTTSKSVLQQQISDSCKQIINKFDTSVDDEGDEGDGGIIDESHGLNKETAFVYQKLVASFEKMATGDDDKTVPNLAPHSSPPLIAKVMHHIGSRLVALMHEVSSGESHKSNSPKTKHYHRRLQHKLSSASSTTTEDDCPEGGADHFGGFEDNLTPYNLLPRSRSHDLLVSEARTLHQSSGGVSDIVEEREASDCERFSWRGSFESALLATDSRNKLSLLGGEASASALAIAAKRRSAGDLLFSHKSLSREQLDRVRSCGSIGGANSEDKLWVASAIRPNRRRSSVPDASCGSGGSADGEDEDEEMESRSTLPRSLQSGTPTTNSLPRLPTNASSNIMQKSQSMHQFLPQNVKSARYRPPGFSRLTTVPKRAVSAPGLQPSHQRRGRRSQQNVPSDEASISEAQSSPMLATRNGSKSATPSPVAPSSRRNTGSSGNDWHNDEDIDRLVRLHGRTSLSTLGMRSDSMASVYSGAGEGRYGTVTVRGQVEFGLQYNYKAGALEIQIKQCKDLAPVDVKRNRSDPYVKVYLLPDKSKSGKRKTKVKKHTLNPVFDECLKFHIPLNGLESRTLWLTVWHSDMFGRNDFLGEVMMTLENKVFDDPTPKWYNLQERTEPFEDFQSYKGDIIVCLKFVPPDMTVQKKGKRSRGALHVLVKEAKSLAAVKANGTSDPFCKSYLLPDKGRSSKQKTPIARRTIHPVWNYTFVYDDVTLQELAERCLELTVWDHDRLASNEFLGGVRFSLGTGKHFGKTVEWMDATGRELSLWKNMLEKPNFWVEGCLSLRSSLDTRVS